MSRPSVDGVQLVQPASLRPVAVLEPEPIEGWVVVGLPGGAAPRAVLQPVVADGGAEAVVLHDHEQEQAAEHHHQADQHNLHDRYLVH